MTDTLLTYDFGKGVEAFSTRRDCALPYHVIQPHQIHSDNVAVIDRPDYTREELEGIDALITDLPGVAIGVRTADCIPVLISDPVHRAVGAVHSGWRGTVNRISACTVQEMARRYGSNPSDLLAVIGPGISADSFQVGPELVENFMDAGFPMDRILSFRGPRTEVPMEGGYHIDLWEAVRLTLLGCGLQEWNVNTAGICTYKSAEFFSARREGASCGRIISSIKICR